MKNNISGSATFMDYKISIITPTLNSGKMLPQYFSWIKKQKYPKDKVEILIMDGGSTDDTIRIARKNNAEVINNPKILAEPGVDLGASKAKGDIFIIMAVDNFLEQSNFLSTVNEVFKDQEIVAAFPKQDSNHSDTIYSKYSNTFTDPFNHFIYGDAANSRTFYRVYKTRESNQVYDIYDYRSSDTLPMIAFAQAFVIRSNYRRNKEDAFDDCMPVIRLIESGKRIAYIHSLSVYHHTINNLQHFVKKQRWATINAITKENYGINHRAVYLSKAQKILVKLWPFYAVSIVFPIIYSICGAVRDKNILWLVHPYMCLISVYSSITAIMFYKIKNQTISRQ